MKQTIRLGVILALFWVMLSGLFSPLMLSFGLLSVILVIWLNHRMDAVDKENLTLYMTLDVIVYILRLSYRVVISNITVTLRILGLKPLTAQIIELEIPFHDDLTKVMYANSITLTPGTVSITMQNNRLLVHTISIEDADALFKGDMLSIIPRTREIAHQHEAQSQTLTRKRP
jgi:multicomponent Na+:H+ antiporter subunit E